MIALMIILLERAAIILLLAYILMNSKTFKKMILHRNNFMSALGLFSLFLLFSIFSNLSGVLIETGQLIFVPLLGSLGDDAVIANTRVLSIGVSGLIGGPIIGSLVGLFSGIFRYLQGGNDPHIYFISSIVTGIISGLIGRNNIGKQTFPSPLEGGFVGVFLEFIQMLSIYLFSSNKQEALDIINIIIVPMTLINSLGISLFLSIIQNSIQQEEALKAIQTHDVLNLTKQTFPYFYEGLNNSNAQEIAQLIRQTMRVSAVSITNEIEIMAYSGVGSDHHLVGEKIITDITHQVLRSGKISTTHSKHEIGCNCEACPLQAAIIVPLKSGQQTIGTLKYYFTNATDLTEVEREWAEGLGDLFSTQLQLGIVESQKQLLKQAELRSLQGQVNPHFFFNTLNTISAIIRIDADKARRLLLKLSQYFRSNLTGHRHTLISVASELKQVEAYLEIIDARFPNQYEVKFDIDDNLLSLNIPPFLIQILVENSISHAFEQRMTANKVKVSIQAVENYAIFQVEDNGIGINPKLLGKIGQVAIHSDEGTGTGLENLNRRLIGLYGIKSQLVFTSSPNGTTIKSKIPYQSQYKEEQDENIIS